MQECTGVRADRIAGDEDDAAGLGRVGELDRAVPLREFAALAAAALPVTVGGVRSAGDPGQVVRRVAVCGGSGGSSSGNGSLSVLMSDAPPNLGNVTAVNVTVTKVEVHPGDGTETGDTSTDPS